MTNKGNKPFCIECRKDTHYYLQKKNIIQNIRGKDYSFVITVAICAECDAEMSLPGLIDTNIQEIDEQFRAAEGLVSIADIEKLMRIYQIGKAPLSLALGFGEITITRYLEGQVPSTEYSDVIRKALASPAFMKQKLMENQDKLTDTAFRKALLAVNSIERQFSISTKMTCVISSIFEALEEVTPLMLQKLLYFIQGIHEALYGKPVFEEECRAWVHGPVYSEVYDLFRDFKYDPIDDARFVLLEGAADTLLESEKRVIDLVVNTFGMYSGRALERITHNEDPWMEARKGYGDGIPSNVIIPKKSIKKYYTLVNQKYDIGTESGLMEYIQEKLNLA